MGKCVKSEKNEKSADKSMINHCEEIDKIDPVGYDELVG
jgi:hypothetical protein